MSESYFQHADHYMRIVKEKALNQSKVINVSKEAVIKDKESTSSSNNNDLIDQGNSAQEKK